MNRKFPTISMSLLAGTIGLVLIAGCTTKKPMTSKVSATQGVAAKQPAAKPASNPKAELAAIAEEAYLYGFPMIVGYAMMDKYFIDAESGQFKAPIGQLNSVNAVEKPVRKRRRNKNGTHLRKVREYGHGTMGAGAS